MSRSPMVAATKPVVSPMTPVTWSLILCAICSVSLLAPATSAHAQEDEPNTAEDSSRSKLGAAVTEYLEQLDGAANITGTADLFGIRICFYEDAWKTYALRQLQTGLAAGRSVKEVTAELQGAKKKRRALKSKSCFRLVLLHPRAEENEGTQTRTVHYFLKSLPHSIRLKLGKAAIPWQTFEESPKLESRKINVARHYTAKRNQRVPFISPLKPEQPRVVFQDDEASTWGICSNALFKQKKGQITCVARYELYHGKYENHIVDLNEPSHRFEQEQTLSLSGALPFLFPSPPAEVEEFLEKVSKRR